MFVQEEALYNVKNAETTISKDVLKTFTMDFFATSCIIQKFTTKNERKKPKELFQILSDNDFGEMTKFESAKFELP
jgi:hypothetical protein